MIGKRKELKFPANIFESLLQHLFSQYFPVMSMVMTGIMLTLLVNMATAEANTDQRATHDAEPLVFLGNHRLAPMNYLENNQAKGLVVDIVNAMSERMERPVTVTLMDWAKAQEMVLAGEADALIQINATEERKLLYDFSEPLLESRFAIFIPADKPGITSILDLRGLTVASEARGFSIRALQRDPLIIINPVSDLISGFNLLLEGSVDAVVGDQWVGSYILAENNIKGVIIAEQPIDIQYSSIAVKTGNVLLLAEINKTLDEIKQDGTYQRIIDRWQAQEVIFRTIEQERRQRLIIAATLAALLTSLALVSVLFFLIKKRKEAEEKVASTNKMLEMVMNNIPQFIFWKDRNSVYLGCNENQAKVAGLNYPHEIVGKTDYDLSWKKEEADFFREDDQRVMNSGVGEYHIIKQKLQSDGKQAWFDINKVPLFDKDGNVIGILGTYEDITERKRAEEALKKARDEYQSITDLTGDIIVQVDNEGRLTFLNEYARVFWGHPGEKLLGRLFSDYLHPDDQEATSAAVQEMIKSEYPLKGLINRQWTPRGWRIVQWNGAPLYRDGAYTGFQATGRDITEQKQAEEKLHEYAQQMKLKTVELDAALIKAEQASLAKGEFLANMSHEIRTPMNAVIGLSDLLMQTELDVKQRDYLTKINSSSRMLLGIINDILDYSKIEAGKLELDVHTFRMDELLDQMKTLFGSSADDKGLEIIFNIPPDVPRALKGDSLRLGQVFTNLLGNAVKFTEKGHVELAVKKTGVRGQKSEVRSQESEDRGQRAEEFGQRAEGGSQESGAAGRESEPGTVRLLFEIKDTGIGMDDDQIQRLFQPFAQADTSTTRKYGGTGLGLVISHKLVQRMGGQLRVESTPGQGSRFYFELDLPLAADADTIDDCLGLEGNKVLVVDDHEAARQVLRNILESCMFQVTEAHDGRSAVDAVVTADKSGEPYDFVFMDWKMPGEFDGLQAAQEIDRLHADGVLQGNKPPFVIVSAYQRDELPEHGTECFNCFVSKPVTAFAIFNAIADAAGKAPSYTRDPEQFTIPSFQGYSILLAEDNALNQEVAWQMLEQTGAALNLANNGAEAVEMVEAGSFDLVLMDLQMPVMDGFEAARRILERFPDLPVIALSAAVMEEDRKKSKQAGMRDHLSKPIDSARLYRTLAKWLRLGDTVKVRKMQPEQDASLLPESLEGFDLGQGLKSTNKDPRFYHRMLHRFRDQLSGEFARIDEELCKGKHGDGPRLAHTLKGLAGTVGAVRLAQAARSVDLALKEDNEIPPELRRELILAMEQARSQLDSLEKAPGQPREVDQEEGAAAMAGMLQMLKNSEMVQDELLETVTGFLRGRVKDEEVDTLTKLVDTFEHDAAAEKLLELASRTGVRRE